ncbi:MAG TPA: hypothetical protein VFC18_04080 [Burkholderiales bacterium]|nr:hypothetical protein [Burkholderiales bacterium]
MTDKNFDFDKVVQDMASSYAEIMKVGMAAGEQKFVPAIRALEQAFFSALIDPETNMKTALQVAICHVLALAPSPITSKVQEYADVKIKRDQLARHEGRADHDTTTFGTRLYPGA